jgi:ABC-type proline/glycine betaine transport system permease subunit
VARVAGSPGASREGKLDGDLDHWGDFATGALFAGECLAACVGAGGLVEAVIHNANTNDMEMAPVLAGLLMLTQAGLALLYLVFADKLGPRVDDRTSA